MLVDKIHAAGGMGWQAWKWILWDKTECLPQVARPRTGHSAQAENCGGNLVGRGKYQLFGFVLRAFVSVNKSGCIDELTFPQFPGIPTHNVCRADECEAAKMPRCPSQTQHGFRTPRIGGTCFLEARIEANVRRAVNDICEGRGKPIPHWSSQAQARRSHVSFDHGDTGMFESPACVADQNRHVAARVRIEKQGKPGLPMVPVEPVKKRWGFRCSDCFAVGGTRNLNLTLWGGRRLAAIG